MNNILKYLFISFITLLVCSCFVACDDDDDAIEIDKWSVNCVYLQRPVLGSDSKQFNLSHTAAGVAGDTEIVMPIHVRMLKPYATDVKVKLGYTTNAELPDIVSFRNSGVLVIPAGEVIVRDTLDLTANWHLAAKPKTDYITTVEIESVEPVSGDLRRSENQSALGLIISKSAFLNMSFSTSSVPSGTSISNRSVWNIVIQPEAENADKPGRLVDNSTGTDIAADLPGFWLTIDLTKTTTVTGFRVLSWASAYAPRGVEIYTSDDGTNWESQGVLATSGSSQYIKFLTPVTCQHIKYDIITGSSNGRLSLTEFFVYEQ